MSEQKRLFGLVRYRETEDGDRLTHQSVKDTVHVGMGVGVLFSLFIAYTLFTFMTDVLGQTVGLLAVVAFLGSWGITSYFSYPTILEKVEGIFRKQGEFYERDD